MQRIMENPEFRRQISEKFSRKFSSNLNRGFSHDATGGEEVHLEPGLVVTEDFTGMDSEFTGADEAPEVLHNGNVRNTTTPRTESPTGVDWSDDVGMIERINNNDHVNREPVNREADSTGNNEVPVLQAQEQNVNDESVIDTNDAEGKIKEDHGSYKTEYTQNQYYPQNQEIQYYPLAPYYPPNPYHPPHQYFIQPQPVYPIYNQHFYGPPEPMYPMQYNQQYGTGYNQYYPQNNVVPQTFSNGINYQQQTVQYPNHWQHYRSNEQVQHEMSQHYGHQAPIYQPFYPSQAPIQTPDYTSHYNYPPPIKNQITNSKAKNQRFQNFDMFSETYDCQTAEEIVLKAKQSNLQGLFYILDNMKCNLPENECYQMFEIIIRQLLQKDKATCKRMCDNENFIRIVGMMHSKRHLKSNTENLLTARGLLRCCYSLQYHTILDFVLVCKPVNGQFTFEEVALFCQCNHNVHVKGNIGEIYPKMAHAATQFMMEMKFNENESDQTAKDFYHLILLMKCFGNGLSDSSKKCVTDNIVKFIENDILAGYYFDDGRLAAVHTLDAFFRSSDGQNRSNAVSVPVIVRVDYWQEI